MLPFETTTLISRPVDLEPIASHLVAKLTFEHGMELKQLTPEANSVLSAYHWPGNVAELQDTLDNAVIVAATENYVDSHHIDLDLSDAKQIWTTLADVEAKHIRNTVAITGGDVDRAASMLGISPGELHEKLADFE